MLICYTTPWGFQGGRHVSTMTVDSISEFRSYGMLERAMHADFGIRCQDTALPNLEPHRHDYFQIHIQLQGDTIHHLGGVVRPVRRNTMCFILPSRVHYIPTVAGSRYFILNASASYLFPWLEGDVTSLEHVPVERAPELMPFRFQEDIDFVFSDVNMEIAESLCEMIRTESACRKQGTAIMIRGYLLQLIALVWREHGARLSELSYSRGASAARRPALARLFSFLYENIDRPLSLTEAAAAVHLSSSYLARLLKIETGKTFVQLLTELRISHARKLLIHSNRSIKEIGFLSGFSDISYFSRRFRQMEGCSPAAFRAKARTASQGLSMSSG